MFVYNKHVYVRTYVHYRVLTNIWYVLMSFMFVPPVRVRAQKKKELELEVARLRKQVKRKRKAALNSSGIGKLTNLRFHYLRGLHLCICIRVIPTYRRCCQDFWKV